eukprot:7569123-Karenia_brevis.AAC.1
MAMMMMMMMTIIMLLLIMINTKIVRTEIFHEKAIHGPLEDTAFCTDIGTDMKGGTEIKLTWAGLA